jgi:pre-mRNA-processing factor SLU7
MDCNWNILTFRNLRIREDTAKYLLNLDVNSSHYDPKTRSMREDPLPEADPNEKFYLVTCLED